MGKKIINVSALLKRVKDPQIRERLLIVKESYNESLREVGKKFSCTHGKVDFWRKRFEKEGLHGLYTQPRSGRPSKITKKQAVEIRKIVSKHDLKHGWRTTQIKETIRKKTGVTYSKRQVIRISQSWGLSKIKPRPRYAYSKKEDREAFIKKTKDS